MVQEEPVYVPGGLNLWFRRCDPLGGGEGWRRWLCSPHS